MVFFVLICLFLKIKKIGLGRTGTFCVVHYVLERVEKDKNFKIVSIGNMIVEMRKSRYGVVQTVDQLEFIYKSIEEGLNQNISEIDLKKSAKQLQQQSQAQNKNPSRHYQAFSPQNNNPSKHYQAFVPKKN